MAEAQVIAEHTRVFSRDHKNAGETVYDWRHYLAVKHALSMEERALSVEWEVFGMDTQLKGPLKLTASHDVLTRLVVHKLPRFTIQYPGIDIAL